MGIQVIITGDNFASIKGDMQDFVDGGYLDVQGADFEAQDPQISTTEIPFPAAPKQKRTRKTKAAAPAAVSTQTSAPTLPAPSASSALPAAAAPIKAVPPQNKDQDSGPGFTPPLNKAGREAKAEHDATVMTVPLDISAVAPGGAVFNAVKAYNDKHGMEKARALLLEFGCGMVRQIKPEQYAAVIAKCAE